MTKAQSGILAENPAKKFPADPTTAWIGPNQICTIKMQFPTTANDYVTQTCQHWSFLFPREACTAMPVDYERRRGLGKHPRVGPSRGEAQK